mmetsp:Transcript_14407/g.23800  ORF Transcript_14407/g.23800 Transcript_14407/m.23800 type:complete len:390 (-) Transcript_14407:27-1196(-)
MLLSLASKSPRLPLFSFRTRRISSSTLTITPTTDESRFASRPKQEDLKFGTTFSDHMLCVEYKNGAWQEAHIRPYANLELSPAASSLHYGLSCFEGMKAYQSDTDDNSADVRLFRPEKNIHRLKASMERLQMPGTDFDTTELLELLKRLVRLDQRWIPKGNGYSLYIRPTVIATHPYLGLAAPAELLLYIITSPVGPYYATGSFQPISLLATSSYVRAWPGGTGCNKVGGNYAPTMKPQAEAVKKGFSQVLWLFGENDEVTEVGGMNIFFVMEQENGEEVLVTPPLDRGDILPGVTRDSIVALAKRDGLTVEERFPTMAEIKEAADGNRLKEAFGTGTAAVVTPIEGIQFQGSNIRIPATGEWTQRFWDELTGIQYGRMEGPEGWSVVV